MQSVFEEITERTDAFCLEYLNEEYADVCRRITAALCRKRPCPVLRGRPRTWAASIIYTAGQINFLSDPHMPPVMTTRELSDKSGVGASTMQAKKKTIQDALNLFHLHPDYTVDSMMDDNPLVWMIEVNGLAIDARIAPREIQEIAYEKGLIPYIPDDAEPPEADVENRPNIIEFPSERAKSAKAKNEAHARDAGATHFDDREP
jgi:hypothetical protein